jgi:hypothetical protein
MVSQIQFCLVKILIVLVFIFELITPNAFGYDLENGVWKNLNEEYSQTIDNKKLVSGMLFNRISYENTFDSDNSNDEYKNANLNSRLGLNFKLSNSFSIKSVIKFEDVSNQRATFNDTNRFFEDEGMFLDEWVLGYDRKNFSALAGKFNPNFGDAWKISNGIWVNEIAKNYETDEKIGFGIIQRAGNEEANGKYVFGLSVFTNDRKNLDNSIITKRDSDSKTDGKVGDTRSLSSYVVSTDIYYKFGEKEKLSYHFAYLNLAINDRQNTSNIPALINDQKGFVANMNYKYPVNKNFLLDSFIEYASFRNFGGDVDKKANFLTINFTGYIYDSFLITLAKAQEKQIKIAQNGVDSSIEEISIGYKFDNLSPVLKNLLLRLGYQQNIVDQKVSSVESRSFGALVQHKIEF